MSSLKKRIITAVIIVPILLAMIFFLKGSAFYFATVALYAWFAWEWLRLIPVDKTWHMFLGLLLYLLAYSFAFFLPVGILLLIAVLWWLCAPILLVLYSKQRSGWYAHKWLVAVMGLVVTLPFGVAANILVHFEHGQWLLVYAIALIACADSGAYFIGRWKGNKKLAPSISPNKTYAGLWGGLCCSALLSLIAGILFHLAPSYLLWFVCISVISALYSVVGDLFISMIKRLRGVKDTGVLLPGHGGILDRCDAMCAGIPLLTLGLLFMSVG